MPDNHTFVQMSHKDDVTYSPDRLSKASTNDNDPQTPLLSQQQNGAVYQKQKTGFLQKIRSDKIYRSQLLGTMRIWLGVLLFGWTYGQVGTTLPDLQLLLGVGLDTASWLFSSFSLGYMLGCLLGGLFVGRKNSFLLLAIYCSVGTVTVVALPFCPTLWLMLAVRVLHGYCMGGMDTTGHAEMFVIWKLDAAVYMQGMYLSFAIGGILSPFATNPFLAQPLNLNKTSSLNGSSNTGNSSTVLLTDFSGDTTIQYGETRIHYAFIISGILTLISAISYFQEYSNARRTSLQGDKKQGHDGSVLRKSPSKPVFVLVICTMTLLLLIVTGLIDTFSGYLMSFSLYQFHWSKEAGALLTSMFWVSFSVGSFVCIAMVLHYSTTAVILLYLTGSVAALIGLVFSSLFNITELTWLFVMLTGFFTSALWPIFFTWTEQKVTAVSGNVASLFLVSGSIGLVVNPLAYGTLMDNLSPMWFVYLSLAEAVGTLILFCCVVWIYHTVKSPSTVVDV